MINFTVGPVQSPESVLRIGATSCPYFRTAEFSEIMLESEDIIKEFAGAPKGSKAVFLTGSGTASMEAAVMNVLTENDLALIVNGGSFGHRFCRLCEMHDIPHVRIDLSVGRQLRLEDIEGAVGQGNDRTRPTAFLVNVHETTTGVHYDLDLIGDYCRRNGLLLIVDAISSFLADDFDMSKCGADVMIAGSQKALACPPGVSVLVLGPRALERIARNEPKCMYLDLKDALTNQERGQTPFTPAVGTLLQVHARLLDIQKAGGCKRETERIASLAKDFRQRIVDLPLKIVSEAMSNAVTPLTPTNGQSAYDIFLRLKDEHGIWVCPNGGDLRDSVFRVGHIGALTVQDNEILVSALKIVMGGAQ